MKLLKNFPFLGCILYRGRWACIDFSKGYSGTEIRKQSLEKIKTESYLAKIVKENSGPKVRQGAIKGLEEITNGG